MADELQTATSELEALGYKQELNRSMNLWHLTAFGLNYMIPIAPAIIFGFILIQSGGTVALPYLLAGLGMLFTANSYMVMLPEFPLAGSLYSYVSRAWHPFIGFLAGWVLLLDYLLIPTVTAMSSAIYLGQLFPSIPFEDYLLIFTISTGLINLFGVSLMAKLGLWLLVIGEIVIFTGFFVWSHAVQVGGVGVGQLISAEPFHFTSIAALATATSLAIFSYLGFDAITTLSEEAVNPKRDVPWAILLSVIIGGGTMVITGYLAMLTIPDWRALVAADPNWASSALFYVAKITGGKPFMLFYVFGFLLAMAVFNVVATAAGSRLLFGMGRDRVLPHKIFAAVNKRYQTPHWNILLIVAGEIILGSLFHVDTIAELVNYGAILGFMILNLSVIWYYFIRKTPLCSNFRYWLRYLLLPACGAGVMLWVFTHMRSITLRVGTLWLLIGLAVMCFTSLRSYLKPH